MEKKELIKNLYDLRTGLLLLALQCDDIDRRNWFDNYVHQHPMFIRDLTEPHITGAYLTFENVKTPFDPKSGKEWPAINELIEMADADRNHILFEGLIKYIPDYVFLFDHMSPKPVFDKYWKKATKSKSTILRESVYEPGVKYYSKFPRSFYGLNDTIDLTVEYFKYKNINVLKIQKQICEDALKNKNSPLLKYYKEKIIQNYFIPKIDWLIEHHEENAATDVKYCLDNYYMYLKRTDAEVKQDQVNLKQVKEAIKILEDKYNFISRVDWNDIDAFIYFLETGRADTMKEALNLNDLKKYKDEIVASVNRVNDNVIRGITAIRQDLHRYFSTLFYQLNSLNASLESVAGEIANNTRAINYSSDQICRLIDRQR